MTAISIDRSVVEQALEALEHHGGNLPWNAFVEVRKDLRAALAQEQAEPVQEPVAWMLTDADNQRVKFLEWQKETRNYSGAWIKTPLYTAPPQRKPLTEPDLSRCPQCNGPADNGHDRGIPPNPYLCTKCMAEPVAEIIESEIKVDSHQTLDDAMRLPRAMAQAYENGYKAGVAARDAEHQQTLALQQRSYEREIQLDVEAERERCLRLIDEHVRAVDAEDLVRAIKEGKE